MTVVAEAAHLQVARIGALPSVAAVPALPDLSDVGTCSVPAAVVAFLAALESLLSARVADGMSDAPRHDPDRELFGQGLANIASGLCGGMPATGAIARTAVNARAGAHTRLAALTHALVLAAIVYAASGAGRADPARRAGRGAAGHRLPDGGAAQRARRAALDPQRRPGVHADRGRHRRVRPHHGRRGRPRRRGGPGAGAPGQTARATVEPLSSDGVDSAAEHALLSVHVLTYRLDGPLFFAAAARFLSELTATTDVRVVILRLSDMAMLDATGARALGEIVEQLAERGITVLLKGASPEHTRLLTAVGTLSPLLAQNHVFTSLTDAVAHARKHVARMDHGPGSDHTEAPAPPATTAGVSLPGRG